MNPVEGVAVDSGGSMHCVFGPQLHAADAVWLGVLLVKPLLSEQSSTVSQMHLRVPEQVAFVVKSVLNVSPRCQSKHPGGFELSVMVVTVALTVASGTNFLKALLHAVEDRTWVVEKLWVHCVREVFHTAAAIVSDIRRRRKRRPGRRRRSCLNMKNHRQNMQMDTLPVVSIISI